MGPLEGRPCVVGGVSILVCSFYVILASQAANVENVGAYLPPNICLTHPSNS
jgi:hypothetical protein